MDNEKKITNDVVLDGEPKFSALRRPSIKLKTSPQILVALPVGPTDISAVLQCPEDAGGCGGKWQSVEAFTVPAVLPVQFLMAHTNLINPLNVTMTYSFEWGRLSAEARQIMTKKAIRMGCKYILYWDIDTLPPQLGLYTLHNFLERNPEAGAVSGVYTTRQVPNEPLMYLNHGEGSAWEMPLGEGAEPVPIFGAGAGFMLARVEAIVDTIEKMKAENGGQEVPIWADERTVYNNRESNKSKIMWGHDIRFCHLLNTHGWTVYGDGRVLCDHVDIPSGEVYSVPEDAPGFRNRPKKNVNTDIYWDQVYSNEGADTWRKYPEMFGRVAERVHSGTRVVELGCGVGLLGSKLTAEKQVDYRGFDISPVAVEMAKARFLRVEELDLRALSEEHLVGAAHVVATEVMEHLDEDVFYHVCDRVLECPSVESFIFTTPDGCMGPDQVPEHTALFSVDMLRERLLRYENGWSVEITPGADVDGAHLVCVMHRQ